jgi:hypothetical protein
VPIVARCVRGRLQRNVKDPSGDPLSNVPDARGPLQQPTQAGIECIALTKQRGELSKVRVLMLIHAPTMPKAPAHGLSIAIPPSRKSIAVMAAGFSELNLRP